MYRYLRYVPKNRLSRTAGRLVHARLPRPIARRLVRWFARTYQIDVGAAALPIEEYPSIGHFFIRDLREGLRPIEGDFVSPVDGVLRNYGPIADGRLALGTWQGIFLFEHREQPSTREVVVSIF